MSMDFYLRRYLYALLVVNISAGPLFTASLTPFLAQNIPTCAQSCLESFIADNFPSPDCISSDFCTCTSDSVSGFSLGEGALQCLVLDCGRWNVDEAEKVYTICDGYPNARPNTHAVLTVEQTSTSWVSPKLTEPTRSPSSKSTRSSRTPSHSTSVHKSTSSSVTLSPKSIFRSTTSATTTSPPSSIQAITSTSPSTTSSTSISSTLSSSATASSSIAAAPASTPALTKPQVAGVVVATTGASALAFGLGLLFFFWRRKKPRQSDGRESMSSFGGDKNSSSGHSSPDSGVIAARGFGYDPQGKEVTVPKPALNLETPLRNSHNGWNSWNPSTSSDISGRALVSGAQNPSPSGPSPITPGSHKTTSQLLPDKPSAYTPFPPPFRPSPRSRRASQNMEAYAASRNHSNLSPPSKSHPGFPLDTSQFDMQQNHRNLGSSPSSHIYGQYQAYRPRSQHSARSRGQSVTPPPPLRPKSILRKPLPETPGPVAHDPSPFTSKPRPPPPLPPIATHARNSEVYSDRKNNKLRRKKSDPRPETFISTASETDAETIFEENDDNPEPVSALSPVGGMCSPDQPSPIVYPPIPHSAAESPSSRIRLSELPATSQISVARLREEEASEASRSNEVRRNAKWKILVEPGLRAGIDSPSSSSRSPQTPRTPRTAKSTGEAPWHDSHYPPNGKR